MDAPDPPFVSVLRDCNVRYRGRARAEQSGGHLAVLLKENGAVVAHSLEGKVSPRFYNPGGDTTTWVRLDRLYIRAVSSDGEILKVNGVPEMVHETSVDKVMDSAARHYVESLEDELASWISENPEAAGLDGHELVREETVTGGRVDLFFEDGTAVEVKRQATVRAYDQAQRYLRDKDVRRVLIACLDYSQNLEASCEGDESVQLVSFDAGTLPPGLAQPID